MMELPGRERSLTISSAVWIQCTSVTDGRTVTGRQQRPRLRIASRGKNWLSSFFCVILLTNKQTNADEYINSLARNLSADTMMLFIDVRCVLILVQVLIAVMMAGGDSDYADASASHMLRLLIKIMADVLFVG